MAQFGASIQTAQVTTGNFRTTIDVAVTGYAGYPTNPGNRAIPGAAYYDSTGTNSNPWGAPLKVRYVLYSSTSNPAVTSLTAPAPCYWVDATFTSVTPVYSEGLFGINGLAGLILPNTTSISGLTNTQINGNYIWICVAGYVSGVIAATSTASGDVVIGSTTNFLPGRIAAGSNITQRILGFATTAIGTPASGQCNMLVTLES